MLFAVVFIVLLGVEWWYFQLAGRFHITDKPNQRSSHTQSTLRGGGIVYPVSVILFFFGFHYSYPWFCAGMLTIAAISFADDLNPQPKSLRLLIHAVSVLLMLYQLHMFQQWWPWWMVAFVLAIGLINAYNFMDGINGITACYSFAILASVYVVNLQYSAIDNNLLYCLTAANFVFAFFNVRKRAKCFAGDIGSISIAYALAFVTARLMLHTGSFIFILFFSVYGVDSVLTLVHRLLKKENIFQPHRQHLYQYLANEKRMPHVQVSLFYMLLQGLVSAGVLWVWKKELGMQLIFVSVVLLVLCMLYILLKRSILQSAGKPNVLV